MPKQKRFGVHHDQDVFNSIRKDEFSSYASYLNVSTSSEGSPVRAEEVSSPEKSRAYISERRATVLPHEPDSEEVTSTNSNIEERTTLGLSTGEGCRRLKPRFARNSSLNAGGKAVENVTFGSIHISSIVPQEWTSTPGDCEAYSSMKTSDSCGPTEESSIDDDTKEALLSPRQAIPNRPVPMDAIAEHSDDVSEPSEVVLHLPDQRTKPPPRIITSSHRELQRTISPAIIDLSSIEVCADGDDSSGLAFRPPSRLVDSTEVLSPIVLEVGTQWPERRDVACGPAKRIRSPERRVYREAASRSMQIGSVSVPKRQVHLTDSWSQTRAVVCRQLAEDMAGETYVPLEKRSAEEREMVAEAKVWLQSIPEASCGRSRSG